MCVIKNVYIKIRMCDLILNMCVLEQRFETLFHNVCYQINRELQRKVVVPIWNYHLLHNLNVFFIAIEDTYLALEKSEEFYFADLKPSMLDENLAVVYAIYDKNTLETLYVGRTKKLRRWVYTNHLHGNKLTARLKKYIVEDNIRFSNIRTYKEAKEWIKENCYFKYIKVEDCRYRGHIEGLLGYILNSIYIENEY